MAAFQSPQRVIVDLNRLPFLVARVSSAFQSPQMVIVDLNKAYLAELQAEYRFNHLKG